MAKRGRKGRRGANLQAIAKAASRAASVHLGMEPVGSVPIGSLLPRARKVDSAPVLTTRRPRQLGLMDTRRRATIRAMEAANGRPIGRRVRQKLEGLVPEAVREVICAPKRAKRAVMFATGSAGKGKRAAARKPRRAARAC